MGADLYGGDINENGMTACPDVPQSAIERPPKCDACGSDTLTTTTMTTHGGIELVVCDGCATVLSSIGLDFVNETSTPGVPA